MDNPMIKQLAGRQLGQYVLKEVIGLGGMSAVYRGYQPALEREVAIKVLSTQYAVDPDYKRRFSMEARTAAALEHRNIVPIYDYGTQDNLIFVVMRLLNGGSLAERIVYVNQNGGALPSLHEVGSLLDTLARALDYAHARQVIHRDIKPNNVMLSENGEPYLVDFGIAHIMNANLDLTAAGTTIGTPNYMAPEQWRDEPLTPAVDQYALGILIFNALTGTLPFKATTMHSLMNKHLNDAPPPVHTIRTNVPQALTPVLARALAKAPDDRYPTNMDFARAFAETIHDLPRESTDFFTFTLPDAARAVEPTPPSPGKVPSAGQAQQVPLAAPVMTQPNTLPPIKSSAEAARAPGLPPELPEVFLPGPEKPPQPAAQPARDAAPQPRMSQQPPPANPAPGFAPAYRPQPSRSTEAQHRQRAKQSRSRQLIMVAAAFGILLVLAVIVFIMTIRLLNMRALSESSLPSSPIVVAGAGSSQPAPGNSQQNPAPQLSPPFTVGGAVITTSNASQLRRVAIVHNQPETPVRMVAMSSQGMLAAAHGDGTVRLWRGGPSGASDALRGHQGVVYTVAFSPDGRLLASGGDDGVIRLWTTSSGALTSTLRGHDGLIRGLSFSPDNQTLASAGEDRTIRLWNVQSASLQATLQGSNSRVLDVAFSPDGRLLASGDETGMVRLWNPESGRMDRIYSGHGETVRSVAFGPDGRLLASSSTDDTVRIWDTNPGHTTHTLTEHGSDVWWTAFNPSGSILASGGRDNTIRLWDTATGNQLAVLAEHTGWVLGLAFSPDGSTLISGSGDGSIRLWRVAP